MSSTPAGPWTRGSDRADAMTTPRTTWTGHYYGGQVAVREIVTVTLAATGLHIERPDGSSLSWPYREIRQADATFAGPARLEHGGRLPETLVVAEDGFLEAIRAVAAEHGGRILTPALRRRRARLLLVIAAAAAALGGALYVWGLPRLAERVAARVPLSWEEQLGERVREQLVAAAGRCENPAAVRAVEQVVARLDSAAPSPYTFRVAVTNDLQVNAFAAPGGFVVVNQGLLSRTSRPEELAGVLAHEMQHVLRRHGTAAILRDVPTRALLGALGGDVSGLGRAVQAVGAVGVLRYQRQDEATADREGMRMLKRAGVDPAGMLDAFAMLEREAGDVPGGLSWISTHPRTAERVATLRALAAEPGPAVRPLLPGVRWADVTKGCGSGGSR